MKKTLAEKAFTCRGHLIPLSLLALLALLPFWRELFSTSRVLSEQGTDIAIHFLYSRMFGFGEIAQGNFPFWNPQIYSGIPYLGQFQSALLYPPNIIFLFLPPATAINWSIALHVFLMGATTYGWASHRRLVPSAAFVAGCSAMFGGAFFLHIYAGHLSNLCTMPWAPLIFWGIDGWIARRHAGWLVLAAGAAALQIYAGHPQYFYYGALVAGLYALVHLPGATRPLVTAGGLLAIYPLAGLFAAAQLLPGMKGAAESVRSSGVNYEFASMFSFPPENLLTLVSPWFFGNMRDVPYWGRCYLWEMSVFAGVGILLLAAFAFTRPWEKQGRLRMLVMLGLILLLALGAHTPLHQILYHYLPGFSGFRGSSKFLFFASILFAFCAGSGLNALWQERKCPPAFLAGTLALGGLFVAGAFLIGPETIQKMLGGVFATKESYLNPAVLERPEILKAFQATAFQSLLIGGGSLIVFAVLFGLSRRWQAAIWVILVCAVLEVASFARSTVVSFPLTDLLYKPVQDFLRQQPGDYRVLNLFNGDASMIFPNGNIWGYDPSVLKRYAQLLAVSQGLPPEAASQYLQFRQPHPMLSLLRGQFVMAPKGNGELDVQNLGQPFPRFFLVSRYEVFSDSASLLKAVGQPGFDFQNTVALEEEPIPAPDGEATQFEVRALSSSTDHWELEVTTSRSAILVMTDSYSADWRAVALPGSVQTNYRLMPANHALRAIPLTAGKHRLRIEYVQSGFRAGALLTLVSVLGCLTVLATPRFRQRLSF